MLEIEGSLEGRDLGDLGGHVVHLDLESVCELLSFSCCLLGSGQTSSKLLDLRPHGVVTNNELNIVLLRVLQVSFSHRQLGCEFLALAVRDLTAVLGLGHQDLQVLNVLLPHHRSNAGCGIL